jgi:hypothetical protein
MTVPVANRLPRGHGNEQNYISGAGTWHVGPSGGVCSE